MSDELSASIATMREVVARLRMVDSLDPAERETLVSILEPQIAEMEAEQKWAWS